MSGPGYVSGPGRVDIAPHWKSVPFGERGGLPPPIGIGGERLRREVRPVRVRSSSGASANVGSIHGATRDTSANGSNALASENP